MFNQTVARILVVAVSLLSTGRAGGQGLVANKWSCEADQVVFGATTNSHFGMSMATDGDWNGDGGKDLLVLGGVGNEPPGAGFITSSAVILVVQSGVLTPWCTLTGVETGYRTSTGVIQTRGGAVSFIGDIDNGGCDDIAIGAPYWSTSAGTPDDRGRVYIFLGELHTTQGSVLAVQSADLIIEGDVKDRLGWAIDGTGDLNDDGLNDLIIGAPGATDDASFNSVPGRVFVYHGSTLFAVGQSLPPSPGGQVVWYGNGSADQILSGGPGGTSGSGGDRFGFMVKFVGDMDTLSGRRDRFVVGAIQARETTRGFGFDVKGTGFAQLYGWPSGLTGASRLADFHAVPGPTNTLALFGFSVARMSSLNLDAIPEVLIGAPKFDDGIVLNTGAVFAFDGTIITSGSSPTLEPFASLGALAPSGLRSGSYFGWSMDVAGLYSGAGDSEVDIGIAAPGLALDPPNPLPCGSTYEYGGPAAGEVFVVDGSLSLTSGSLTILGRYKGDDDGSQSFGKPRLGWSVTSFDVDGDSKKDIVAGVMGAAESATKTEAGKVAVFLHP